MEITHLKAMFGLDPSEGYVSTPRGTEGQFLRVARQIQGHADQLLAIYVPETTRPVYCSPEFIGRVVGAVRLLPLPEGREPQDYNFLDFDGTNRWPVGWPCEVVAAPPVTKCPRLKDLVAAVFPQYTFAQYTARLEHGPFPLEKKMARRLEAVLLSQEMRPSDPQRAHAILERNRR